MKADLHMHGPIGFQDYWLKAQGYKGKNLLKEIADTCFKRNIEICAITSEEEEIPKNSIHDRFGKLKNNYAKDLPKEYKVEPIGENILGVAKGRLDLVYLINGQAVRTENKGRVVVYSVVGSNEIPNHKDLEYTIKYVSDKGIIGGAEHPFCVAHGGMGKENMEKFLPYLDFIEGHDSQFIFPSAFEKIPVFRDYTKKLNEEAKKFSQENNKPWITTSDSHRIEDAGISYIQFNFDLLNSDTEETFIGSLKNIISSNNFSSHCAYESFWGWANWVSKFMIGVKLHRDEV